MSNYQNLKKSILQDGTIDEAEVLTIRTAIYADGTIDAEEAEFLFELNDATTGNANHLSWKALFVEAIASFLLDDENSPGVIDQAEADWLIGKIEGDGQFDALEKALLLELKKKAQSIPSSLQSLLNKLG